MLDTHIDITPPTLTLTHLLFNTFSFIFTIKYFNTFNQRVFQILSYSYQQIVTIYLLFGRMLQ